MNMLSSFIYPHVLPNLYEFLLEIFLRMLVKRQLLVAIYFRSRKSNAMEVNGHRQLSGYQHSSKYVFVFNRIKKFIQVWNNLRLRK